MSYLSGWISQLVLIVLFAVILEILLPSGGFQKYVKLVVGLVLIVVLLDPVMKLFQIDPGTLIRDIGSPEIGKEIKNEIALQKKDIEEGQAAYIQEQVAVQLKSRVQEELIETYGVQIHHINLSVEQSKNREVSISSAEVFLEQADPEKNHTATGGIRPIEEVTVAVEPKDTSDSGSGQESVDNSRILSFLAGRWEMDKKFISLRMEGGT